MIRIDGSYLYSIGYSVHPLNNLEPDAPFPQWIVPLYVAQNALDELLNRSVFRLATSRAAGQELLGVIQGLTADPNRKIPINVFEAYQISNGVRQFEIVLAAELGLKDMYLVTKKRGYDTTDLILNGVVLFPADLPTKVPDSVKDVNEAARCIAFELPTAAGFHLHRANESVLHRYYDAVTNGAPRPAGRNIGDYLQAMKEKKAGDKTVLAALRDLKDLHRNPLIHPEDSLDSVDDAIALMGSVQGVVVPMLKVIPTPPPPVPGATP